MPRGNGGVLGPANIPTTSVAKGVWSLMEQQLAQRQGIWPIVLSSDPYFEYTTLLLPGNGTNGAQNNTFLDGSTNNFTITRNGNTTQGTFSPFSQTGWGNYFDGSASFLSVASSAALQLSTSVSWCLEAFVFPVSLTSDRGIIAKRSGTTYEYQFSSNASGLNFWNGSTTYTAGQSLTANQWQHVACTWDGTTLRFFINGNITPNTYTSTFSMIASSTATVNIGANHSGGEYWNGYISNARIVKGSAVYTSSFTPSTTPLTAITNTSLLTCQSNRFIDNSTNNFTITRNGSPTVVAFSPFNPSASWSAATYGGSGYFDGSGDYLTAPDNAAFQFGSGDFTIEFWIYPQATPSGWLIGKGDAASVTGSEISWTAAGTYDFYYGGSALQLTSPALTVGSWQHIAAVRNGTTITIYKNGVSSTSGSIGTSSLNTGGSNPFSIGQYAGGAFNGYFSSLRVVKGTAVYTSNFTPPTAPLTAITNTSLLLNFTNAGIYDATSKNDLETVGNAQISTTQSKWGGSSIAFDGTEDFLYRPDAALNQFGTGDYTIEFWLYPNSFSNTPVLLEYGRSAPGSTPGLEFFVATTSGRLDVYGGASTGTLLFSTTSTNIATGTWTHIALTRASGATRLYFNGTQPTGSSVSDTTNYTQANIWVGAYIGGTSSLNGYIQDLRVTKGYARYTANFTAPTAAFPTL